MLLILCTSNLFFLDLGHKNVQVLNLEAMDKTRYWKTVGCRSYTGEGLLGGFDWLVHVASRIYMLD